MSGLPLSPLTVDELQRRADEQLAAATDLQRQAAAEDTDSAAWAPLYRRAWEALDEADQLLLALLRRRA